MEFLKDLIFKIFNPLLLKSQEATEVIFFTVHICVSACVLAYSFI